MRPKKELGQNFLINQEVIDALVEAGEVSKEDIILEIGPGLGDVTQTLAKHAGFVVAAELDADLIPTLQQNLSDFDNIEIVQVDALKFLRNPEIFTLQTDNRAKINKIVSSLPYQITSPLLHELVLHKEKIKMSALLIQKEVAERILAVAPGANYMSMFLQTFLDISYIATVDKENFDPVPQVDGAIIKIKVKSEKAEEKIVPENEIVRYSKFLHHGFAQQRKMLNKRFDKEILEKAGIDPTRRAETLSVKEWMSLFKISRIQQVTAL